MKYTAQNDIGFCFEEVDERLFYNIFFVKFPTQVGPLLHKTGAKFPHNYPYTTYIMLRVK